MSQPFDHLAKDLQPHYSRFDVANRLLFTGHSHQAWPDAAFEGMHEYETTVARDVDQKWIAAAEKTEILRNYLRRYYDDPDGYWCREQNTHVLMVSWLSSLDLVRKPVILTTSGEFHSMSRQLRSLAKIGVEPVILDHTEDETLLQSIRSHLNNRVSAVMLSRIYFQTAEIQTRLTEIAAICRDAGVPLMIDDYHGTNVVPLSLREAGLEDCYLLIGGYKYLQWGEANCFLRFPGNCSLTPLITGWLLRLEVWINQKTKTGSTLMREIKSLRLLHMIRCLSSVRHRLSIFLISRDSHRRCWKINIVHKFSSSRSFSRG